MKDKVERLAKGIFEYEQPEVLISEEQLSIEVSAGEVFCGKFSVHTRNLHLMKGVLYSSDELLVINEPQFIGTENEITYTVHGEYAMPGEVHKGTITVVSEYGELFLPFVIKVIPVACESSEGEIRDLFQFAGLAQSDWFEAKRLFSEERFATTVLGDREEELNRDFGRRMADCCDEAILVGLKRSQAISAGLREAGFDERRIHPVRSLAEAEVMLAPMAMPGDTILFENDLPDNY